MAKFAKVMKKLRKARGITCYRLAEELGVAWSTVTRLEKGEREPSLEMAMKIIHHLGGSLGEFDKKSK